MEFNFLTMAVAALIPLIMGFIWYGPMLFQKAWMKEMGFTEDSMKGANMALIFGLSYVLSFFIAMMLQRDAHDCEGKKNMLEQRSCHAFI